MAERNGAPPLDAGIYALCMVESAAFDGTGASDAFWSDGAAREPGWPTIRLRYLQTYLDRPLTIERLREVAPQLSPLLLNGHQASSFPISVNDFRVVVEQLGGLDDLKLISNTETPVIDTLNELERKYFHACPEVKRVLSRKIERGPIGALVKRNNQFRCQLCEAMGMEPIGFKKQMASPTLKLTMSCRFQRYRRDHYRRVM